MLSFTCRGVGGSGRTGRGSVDLASGLRVHLHSDTPPRPFVPPARNPATPRPQTCVHAALILEIAKTDQLWLIPPTDSRQPTAELTEKKLKTPRPKWIAVDSIKSGRCSGKNLWFTTGRPVLIFTYKVQRLFAIPL